MIANRKQRLASADHSASTPTVGGLGTTKMEEKDLPNVHQAKAKARRDGPSI
jgi:hypothetical protein